MKTVSILVILAVFYKHSEGLSCKTISDWTGTITLTDKDDCTGNTCARPKREASGYVASGANIAWGCGSDCSVAASCLTCEGDGCNVEPTLECRTDATDDTQKSLCPDKTVTVDGNDVLAVETECKRTLWDGSNFGSTGSWGCGGCAADAPDCAACTSTLCNNVAGADTPTHECRKYEKTTVFAENTEEKDTCYESTPGCRMPSPGNTAGSWNACGKDCTSGGQTAADCRACDAANCNDQATVKFCKTGAHDDAASALVSKFCTPDNSKCQRPFNTYGTLATTINYECGTCSDAATCKDCDGSDCNTPLANTDTHECFEYAWESNAWVAKAKKQCQAGDAAQKCNMPKKDATTPASTDVSRDGCGPCGDGQDAQCTTTDAGKNIETTHKCYTWTWDDEKKWEYSDNAVDCYTLDSETKCSLPKDRSKKDGFVADGTCAKCGTDAAHENCLTADNGKNSGRRVLFSLLALALPIFYALL